MAVDLIFQGGIPNREASNIYTAEQPSRPKFEIGSK